MSASSTISNLQSALDCAGKCDCCDKLQAEINAINARIAGLRNVDENALKASIKASLQPDIAAAVTGGVALAASKLQPQIDNGISIAKEALNKAFHADAAATNSENNSLAAKRLAEQRTRDGIDAVNEAREAKRIAIEAKGKANTADSRSSNALSTAEMADSHAGTATNVANRASTEAFKAQNDAFAADRKATNSLDVARTASQESQLAKNIANQADFKAGNAVNRAITAESTASSAVSTAAKASSEALNAASEVQGLKGVVDGVKSKVGQLGEAIARAERLAGDALVKAANAIGISTEALAATGRLAARILEIFNLIAGLAALVEQLATLNTLGGRIDALENMVQALGNDVSGILGRLLGLQNRIARVEGDVGQVRGIATNARLIAETANLTAGSARGIAIGAQSTADNALRIANRANENASTAYKKASDAQNFAGQAFEKGLEAIGIATTALTLVQLLRLRPGLPGRDGLPGRNGLNGRDGLPGARGLQGIPGTPGRDGTTTVVQIPGVPGRNGERGLPGISGLPGRPGRNGINGLPGKDGKDGQDVNPGDLAGLRALIVSQHTQTRANSTAQHSTTRTTILTPIMAALAPILALLKQIYDAVMAASNAAILALLNIINNKLGVQVLGGLSGFIKQIAENTYLEKALTVLTFAATMHNALMLSNNLDQTLISIIDQVLGFILPKGIDGTPINFSEILKKAVHEVIADTIGEANYTALVEDWQKANRIYQAGANVFNQIGNAVGLVTAGMEVIGGNVAKIGNALKVWGVIGEKAYSWMNPQPNLKGKFFNFINTATDKANTIAMMVAIPIGMSAAAVEINNSIGTIKKELDQEDPKDANGNPITDKLGNPLKWEPGVTVPDPTKTVLAQEQAKADSKNIITATLEDIFDGSD